MFSKITKAPEVLVQRSRFQAQLASTSSKKDLKKLAEKMSQVLDSDEEDAEHPVRLSPLQQLAFSPVHQASPSQQVSHSQNNSAAFPSQDYSPYHPVHLMDSQDPFNLEFANYDPQIM